MKKTAGLIALVLIASTVVGCGSTTKTKELTADSVALFYQPDNASVIIEAEEEVNALTAEFSGLVLTKSEGEFDTKTQIEVVFYKGEKEANRFWVDNTGVFLMKADTYTVTEGEFSFSVVANVLGNAVAQIAINEEIARLKQEEADTPAAA